MSVCNNQYSGLILKSFLEQSWYDKIKLWEKKFVVCCNLHHLLLTPRSKRASWEECIVPVENSQVFRLSITGYSLCLPCASICKFTQKFVSLCITLCSVLVLDRLLKACTLFSRFWNVWLLLVREYVRNHGVINDNLFKVRFLFLWLKYILIPVHFLFSLSLFIHRLENWS